MACLLYLVVVAAAAAAAVVVGVFVVHTAPDPPVLQSAVSSNSQSLVVSWLRLDCGSINSEGVDQYIICYGNADIGDFQANVTAPMNSTTIFKCSA